MPTYEYECKGCGNRFEIYQSFTDEPLTTCDSCGGSLKKVFGNIGISFKGSGFYKNDSRSSSSTSSSSSSSVPSTASPSTTTKSEPTKSESAATTTPAAATTTTTSTGSTSDN